MTIELDEPAARALNDPGLRSAGPGEVIKSVIECTRRHWVTVPEEHLALDAVCHASVSKARPEPRLPRTPRAREADPR